MTSVVVAYASKMGATKGIADSIGEQLARAGCRVEVRSAGELPDLRGFDAAVVGSALYNSRWLREAVRLLKRQAAVHTPMPIWLFQSGWCGEGAEMQLAAPRSVTRLALALGAHPPVTFGGCLDLATAKGFLARRAASGPMAGDYRDFDEIRLWADGVAGQIDQSVAHPQVHPEPVHHHWWQHGEPVR